MSKISSTDEIVTKDVLQDELQNFYGEIYPYLGGMPQIVANKFSKSDLYSTDEKMIGQWIDGKPLYQKSFEGTISGSYDSERVLIPSNILPQNLDTCILDLGSSFIEYPSNGNRSLIFIYTSNAISVWYNGTNIMMKTSNFGSQLSSGKYIVTIRYTKTTDSAISIGSDTDYSTEEKIVGTWIDSKPLYQKTINCGANPTGGNDGTVIATISDMDIGFIECAYLTNNGNPISLPRILPTSIPYEISVNIGGKNILYNSGANTGNYGNVIVTIQYTKTTD